MTSISPTVARWVPFADYSMPVQYGTHSGRDSHLFTPARASLLDVSHMVQHSFSGPSAAAALQWRSPADAADLPEGRARLRALLREATDSLRLEAGMCLNGMTSARAPPP